MLVPRSASRSPATTSRDRPAASVSSVSGVGAKNPRPADTRLVHSPPRSSTASRGLKKVPYSMWMSSRALAESDIQRATSTSSWTKTPGTSNA